MINKPLPPHNPAGKAAPYQKMVEASKVAGNALRNLAVQLSEVQLNEWIEAERRRNPPAKIDYAIPALRAWNLNDNGELISLVVQQHAWEGPVNVNITKLGRRQNNGFWAVKPRGVSILLGYNPTVIGIVELSGTVVEHEYGWRAEVCVIRELYVNWVRCKFELDYIADIYQCDVHPFTGIFPILEKFK